MSKFSGMKVAVVVTDGFEESELVEPAKALREAGAEVDIVSNKDGEIQGVRHMEMGGRVRADRRIQDVSADEYNALVLPGGAINADTLRVIPEAQRFAQEIDRAGKPIAVICHGSWLLASAGLTRGRRMTSYHTIQDDLRNAGAEWVDQEVVVEHNWVSSRRPSDLPAFNREMLTLFARQPAAAG